MNGAIGAFGKDDHLVSHLLAQLAHSAPPAAGCAFHYLLFTLPQVCNGEGKHDRRERNAHLQVIKVCYIPL